jgi:hypothetical protein
VTVEYVPTDQNPADMLTKPLEFKLHDRHRAHLSGEDAVGAP